MESRFFVVAKSFLFSVVNGSDELRVVEKGKVGVLDEPSCS